VSVEKNSSKLAARKPRTVNRVGFLLDEDVDDLQKIFRVILQIRIVDDADVLRGTLSNGAEVAYRLSQDQQALAGEYVLRGRTTLGSFKRQ